MEGTPPLVSLDNIIARFLHLPPTREANGYYESNSLWRFLYELNTNNELSTVLSDEELTILYGELASRIPNLKVIEDGRSAQATRYTRSVDMMVTDGEVDPYKH